MRVNSQTAGHQITHAGIFQRLYNGFKTGEFHLKEPLIYSESLLQIQILANTNHLAEFSLKARSKCGAAKQQTLCKLWTVCRIIGPVSAGFKPAGQVLNRCSASRAS